MGALSLFVLFCFFTSLLTRNSLCVASKTKRESCNVLYQKLFISCQAARELLLLHHFSFFFCFVYPEEKQKTKKDYDCWNWNKKKAVNKVLVPVWGVCVCVRGRCGFYTFEKSRFSCDCFWVELASRYWRRQWPVHKKADAIVTNWHPEKRKKRKLHPPNLLPHQSFTCPSLYFLNILFASGHGWTVSVFELLVHIDRDRLSVGGEGRGLGDCVLKLTGYSGVAFQSTTHSALSSILSSFFFFFCIFLQRSHPSRQNFCPSLSVYGTHKFRWGGEGGRQLSTKAGLVTFTN